MADADLTAACLTESQLAGVIKDKYKKYLLEPYVNVSVREFNSTPVAVIGAVNSPGRFQLQRTIRLTELLTFVSGTSANAGGTAEIIRDAGRPYCQESNLVIPSGGGQDLISVSLVGAFKGGDEANPVIMAGDIVRIPSADQVNAYVQGYVRNSMTINLKDPVTITQAVAMAGGATQGAKLDKVLIRRQIPGSVNRAPILVNVKEINQGKRQDILLQSNDIVEVPGPTGITKFFQQTLVPMVTQLPMRVIY
jgi:polysaccharide export outer membrane protein